MIHGFENSDDAAVYQLDDGNYLLNTVDFFTPIHKNPYIFGQIAAANAVSDIFAVGGTVLNCLNILAFPESFSEAAITDMLRGATDKVQEAGGVIVGGHSMTMDQVIYGLSVNGLVTKEKLKTNSDAKLKQHIILTKKIGTGIYSNLINEAPEREDCIEVIDSMTYLNKTASEVSHQFSVSALTDVTGFGLLGHLSEVMKASKLSANLYFDQVPLFAQTKELCISHANGGMKRNYKHFGDQIIFNDNTDTIMHKNILFDPQTSGGLLIFVDADDSEALLAALHQKGVKEASVIGETVPFQNTLVKVYR